MSGPKEVIWRMLTRSVIPHVANDSIVDAATTRCMQRARQDEMGRLHGKKELDQKKIRVKM